MQSFADEEISSLCFECKKPTNFSVRLMDGDGLEVRQATFGGRLPSKHTMYRLPFTALLLTK